MMLARLTPWAMLSSLSDIFGSQTDGPTQEFRRPKRKLTTELRQAFPSETADPKPSEDIPSLEADCAYVDVAAADAQPEHFRFRASCFSCSGYRYR